MPARFFTSLCYSILFTSLALTSPRVNAQADTAAGDGAGLCWESREITKGITLMTFTGRLFNSDQAIYVTRIDTSGGSFEFGITATPTRRFTSIIADSMGVTVAVNGTFFNMEKGFNVHFVKVNDSIISRTDTSEFRIRATGFFSVSGESAEIDQWTRGMEDHADTIHAGELIVSGPLLIDDGLDMALPVTGFVTSRHPRTMAGMSGDGKLFFIVVDGRQPGYADGMSLYELRAVARILGCADALNLDGGGSTTLYIEDEGEGGVVNKPSGKVQRPVPSILWVKTLQ